VSTWPEWNTFCPEGKIISSPSPDTSKGNDGKEPEIVGGDRAGWLNTGSHCDLLVCMSGDKNTGSTRHQEIHITGIWKLEECEEIAIPEEHFGHGLSSTSIFPPSSSDSHKEGAKRERKGYRIAWTARGWSHWQLHSERVMEFEEVPGESEGELRTLYTCWETFGGLLGGTVKLTVGKTLVERFGDYSRDLKGFAEGKSSVPGGKL